MSVVAHCAERRSGVRVEPARDVLQLRACVDPVVGWGGAHVEYWAPVKAEFRCPMGTPEAGAGTVPGLFARGNIGGPGRLSGDRDDARSGPWICDTDGDRGGYRGERAGRPDSPRGVRPSEPGAAPLAAGSRAPLGGAGRPRDFLAEATPGAGKTTFALHLAHGALAERHVDTLAVICPTTHLRRQWQIAAHRAGIELCSEISGARLDQAFRGAALTYQQVLAEPERYRLVLGGGWVVLDECHHAGEGRSWADALAHAFGDAPHRLSLSGTAFRSDACRIPFIR
ncbi:MAG TPA: DEAD/DEAH box helicase family protein [Longimicrobium sp.]